MIKWNISCSVQHMHFPKNRQTHIQYRLNVAVLYLTQLLLNLQLNSLLQIIKVSPKLLAGNILTESLQNFIPNFLCHIVSSHGSQHGTVMAYYLQGLNWGSNPSKWCSFPLFLQLWLCCFYQNLLWLRNHIIHATEPSRLNSPMWQLDAEGADRAEGP